MMRLVAAMVLIMGWAAQLAEAVEKQATPVIPADTTWAGALVTGIFGMFVLALAVGTAVRANAPEDLPPPAHSHDEPPGASHHHGPGGTDDTHHSSHH